MWCVSFLYICKHILYFEYCQLFVLFSHLGHGFEISFESGIFSSILFFCLFNCLYSDWDVYRNCSPDAYYYLLFQTYLIAYLLFLTIFSLAIILPVNFQGTQGLLKKEKMISKLKMMIFILGRSEQKFAHTTIANLPPK